MVDLRLGIGRSPFSVPASPASLLLLSRAISDSNPSRTKAVFSLTPVKLDAFFNIASSIFSVVLICINMHHFYIYVKCKFFSEKIINYAWYLYKSVYPAACHVYPVKLALPVFNWGPPCLPCRSHDRTGVECLPNEMRSIFHRGETYSSGVGQNHRNGVKFLLRLPR